MMKRKKTPYTIQPTLTKKEIARRKRAESGGTKKYRNITPSNTEAQQLAKKKFGLIGKTIALFKVIWPILVQYKASKYRDLSILFKRISKEYLIEHNGKFSIDYSNLVIAKSATIAVDNLRLQRLEDFQFSFTWDDYADERHDRHDARPAEIVIFILNEKRHKSHVIGLYPYVLDRKIEADIPHYQVGDTLHCWMYLIWSRDKRISAGAYTSLKA